MQDFPLLLKATLLVYRDSLRSATKAMFKNWLIIPAGLGAYLAYGKLESIIEPLGMVGGFILGMAICALVSLYYNWLSVAADNQRLSHKELLHFDYPLFSAVISVAFVLWIARFLVSSFAIDPSASLAPLFLNLAIVLALNAIPEVIYLLRMEGMSALARAFVFTRDNWIEWYFPFVLIAIPGLLLSPKWLLLLLSSAEPMLPVTVVFETSLQGLLPSLWQYFGRSAEFISILLAVVIANWFMLFRAFLFRELDSGSRRRRVYKMKQLM